MIVITPSAKKEAIALYLTGGDILEHISTSLSLSSVTSAVAFIEMGFFAFIRFY